MKSKNKKIQNILMKGIAITMVTMFTATPMVFAANSSLDDSNISLWDKLIYGTVGSTAKEIEEYFEKCPVIYISNEIQLRALAEYVNNGHDCSGKVIYLANNIEVSQEEWVPIGTNKHPFKGTFDGQNYTISKINFNRNNKLNSELSNVGIIGYVTNTGIVKNLKLENSKFDIPYEIASDIIYKSDDLVTESTNGTFMTEIVNVGGIVGHNEGIIENCEVASNVTINGVANVGGIAGENYKGKVEGCINNGKINGFQNVGGIVGLTTGQRDDLKDNNKLDFSKNTVGKIINCKNGKNAVVYSVIGSSGGITGALKWNAIIQRSINEGQIHITTETITLNTVGTKVKYDPQNVGGIVGYASGSINPDNNQKMYVAIDGCINSSDARVKGNQDAGGIAGQLGGQGGGYAILSNSINYTTDIVATNTSTGFGETGYLIGEGGSRGWNTDSSQTYDDSIAILYNNLYFMPSEEEANTVIDNKHQTIDGKIAAYGRFTNQRNTDKEKDPNPYYYDTNTNVFVQRNDKYQIYKKTEDEKYSNIDVSKMYPIYTNSNATAKTSGINYGGNINVKVEDNLLYDYNNSTGEVIIKSGTNSQLVDASTGTTVSYIISKKAKGENAYTEVKGNSYFKAGDTIKVTAKFNRYLASSVIPLREIEAPTLMINGTNDSAIIIDSTVNATTNDFTTTVDYVAEVKQGDNFEITNLKLTTKGTTYAVNASDYATNAESRKSFSSKTITSNISTITIDTVAPIINTKVYVENALETGRYTTGKEVLIEVKTNEAIQVADGKIILPEIQVGFSKSGTGKYNYDEKNNKVGYAKPKSANIGADGVVTWLYSYQIQEGDEGDIQLEYKAGKITDLAGNETDIKELYTPQGSTGSTVSGNSWNNELSVTYEFYKNSVSEENKVTANTYFTKDDDLIAVATFNKVLYVHYGLSDGKNTNVRLTNIHKDRVPSLYLNGDSKLKNTSASISTKNDSTIINYTFDMKSYDINTLTNIEKVILKNENNTEIVSTSGTTAATNGLIPFAEEWYATYKSEDESKYKTVLNNAINTTNDISHIILDPIGVSNNIEQSDIYADTTAPTVEIVAQEVENNITNADKIIYTFTWSEELAKEEGRTFEASDITVNNGTKGELVQDKNDPKVYTMVVTPNVASGNEGDLQVVVEKGACQDLVGHENVRTEKIITVDKKAPTVEITANKDYVQVGDIIKYTFNWSEAVKDFDETKVTVKSAEIVTQGEGEEVKAKFEKINDAQYTLEVRPTDGNDVEVIIENNKCTDIAGNNSIENKHIIQVIPTVKITTNRENSTNVSQIEYTFEWSEQVNGFTAEDIIVPEKAIKGELVTKEGKENTYTMMVDYENIIPAGNQGEVTITIPENAVQDVNANGNAYTINTIKIDRIAPILIGLEAYGKSDITVDQNVDSVKQYYKAGDTVTIVATFNENIGEKTTTVPTLALQFSESGNAKGQVSTGKIEGNKITYTYTITKDDMGLLSVKGFTGKVIDAAGNETVVTKRNLDGDTIIADTVAPKLIGITAIAPDFEYDELVENPGDTKRYGVISKNSSGKNTITIIAEYSENVYNLEENVDKKVIKKITKAPDLKLKFGGKDASGTIRVTEIKENKITYEYDITNNDNGDFLIASINGKVSDIAGNESNINQLPEKDKIVYYEKEVKEDNKVDKITADTRKPLFTISTLPQMATDKDDNGNTITGNNLSNQYYYRKGSIITITATADEYIYKNNSNDLTKFTKDNMPAISLKFGDLAAKGKFTEKDVRYEAGKTIFTYKYEIAEGDNGKLSTSIAGDIGYDIALNGNNSNINAVSTSINADTVNPVTNWQSWVESEQYGIVDNQNGTWKVTFSEGLYTYNPDTHTVGGSVNTSSAPILLVSKDNVTPLETRVSSVTTTNGKTVITYTYSPYTKNIGAYGMKFANVSDKAGNLFNYKDQQAPTLVGNKLEVTSPATGTYKAGQEITIVATFNEKITGTAPTLKLKFGETLAKGTVSGGIIGEDGKTITYKYTITAGDNGLLSLESYTGTGLKDLSDNPWVAPENVTLSGNTITADTIAPTVVITSNVEKTNQDKVTYTFTWSEDVVGFTADDIEVINGLKGTFTKVNNKVYTLEVDTTNEGRQIVKVNANVCTDVAGNPNAERTTYNKVVIDYTKPEIRAKVNGGNYVIDTDSKKSTLKETIVVNEEVSKFEYIWTKDETIPTTGFTAINPDTIQVNSDIHLEAQVVETGTYYLYVKVTDKAGNIFEGRTNAFVISNAQITLTPNTTEKTNQDVTVTINYGNGLTENRKAGVQGKTQSADATKVIAVENGTVYAEATDKAGNKVYATLEITNINKTKPTEPDTPPVEEDKIAPEITFNYTTTTATVGTAIGATITTNEDAMIEYSWDNQNWTSSQDFIRSINARRTPTSAGTYTLYAKATDKASNTSNVSTLQFTVVKSDDDIVKPEIIFEDLTTIQKDGVKYVKVSPNYTTEMLTAKMDKDALLGKTPAYEKLTSDKKLRTGSEITIDGSTKYIIIVNGDVNCDGKVDFLGDIVMINNYRIGVNQNLSEIQILAGDINNSGSIEFIPDIVAMNNYRLGRINVL